MASKSSGSGSVAVKPKAKTAKTTAKKAKTATAKPMSAKAYAAYLKYVNSHYPTTTKVAWSPDGDWPVCGARAVAQALELASGPFLTDVDVLALHRAAGGSRDEAAALLDVLRAAEARFRPAQPDDDIVILGLEQLPEPHAVVVTIDGIWWSWGEPHTPDDFPGAVITEAWAVAA
jgi:hypothetical protein